MTEDLSHIWPVVRAALRRAVPEATFDIWLAPLEAVGLDGPELTVQAPAEIRGWVAERFARPLARAATEVLGPGGRVVVVDTAAGPLAAAALRGSPGAGAAPAHAATSEQALHPKFTFEQFVIGDANRFAHAAALAVAELPGQAYNPLFVYGPPGVGKTHLLHAIARYVRDHGNGLTVRYTTVERFTNEFVTSLRDKQTAAFKGRYRHADVLLIDDVQFLADKTKTEEEFFHTFNALHESGSQLVLTSDRLPRDLDALEDRMRERFESGLVTEIAPPDPATRLTVLRKRVQHDGLRLDDDAVLDVIAERITTNIRALEGALIRVVAFASLTSRDLTADLAAEVLDGLYGPQRPGASAGAFGRPDVTVARVQELVCTAFSVTPDELLSTSRTARLAWPRQVAMYLAREHTQESLPAIGRSFGGRNHTTVMHACRRTTERLATDADAFATVRELTRQLTQGCAQPRPGDPPRRSDRRP